MVNKISIIGHVGKAPDARRLENGTLVCRFSVATTEKYKDAAGEWKEETDWHNVKCYGQNAENVEKYLKQGSFVYVEGKQKHSKYTDKNGVEKLDSHIAMATFKILDKKEKSEPSAPQAPKPQPTPQVRQSDAGFETPPQTAVFTSPVAEETDLPF